MIKTIMMILLPLLAWTAFHAPPATAETIQWLTYDQAQKQSHGQDRKILLYFQNDRCGYCRKLEKETLADKELAAYINANYIPVRVNTDKAPRIAAQHGVRGVPDLHFLSATGDAIANWPGFIEIARLLPLLRYIHTDSYLNMSYSDFMRQQ